MHKSIRVLTLAAGAAVLCTIAMARAEDVPPAPSGGGIKELPGTIEQDVGDAVKKDVGGMLPGTGTTAAGGTPSAAAPATGGVKELPTTVEGHVGDAVQKDLGGVVGAGAAGDPAPGSGARGPSR